LRNRARTLVKGTLILIVVAGLLALAKVLDVQQLIREALDWISSLGPWGGAFFVALYVLATVLFLPGFILTLAAGVLFGVVWGSVAVSVASIAGATLAFLIGRYLARDWVAKRIEGNEKFEAIDQAVAGEGWKIVGLVRLSPVFPFTLLNYAFGITKVSLKDYFLASWIGMLPATVMYVYVGSLAGDLATLGSEERSRTPGEWALCIIGLAATIILTVYITRIARNALQKKVV
jgi:uncharacterized membrane protein YdjX (TVP38/TMEM64 family)